MNVIFTTIAHPFFRFFSTQYLPRSILNCEYLPKKRIDISLYMYFYHVNIKICSKFVIILKESVKLQFLHTSLSARFFYLSKGNVSLSLLLTALNKFEELKL